VGVGSDILAGWFGCSAGRKSVSITHLVRLLSSVLLQPLHLFQLEPSLDDLRKAMVKATLLGKEK
jgi:hypothetical protein